MIEATVGQLVEVRLHNDDVEGGVALHWHGVDVPNAEDGVAGVTQDAVKPGQDTPTAGWPGCRHVLVPLPPDVARAGVGGLFGGIVIAPEEPEPGVRRRPCGGARLRRRPDHQRRHGWPTRAARARTAGSGAPGQHRQRTAGRLGRARRSECVAVDGLDVNQPTEVSGRGVEIPAGGRADLGRRPRPTARPCESQILGRPGLVIGPRALRLLRSNNPRTTSTCSTTAHRHPPGSTPAISTGHSSTRSVAGRDSSTGNPASGGASTATSTQTCR